MGAGLYELVHNRHDVSVGVLDDVKSHVAVSFGKSREKWGNELAELSGAHEGAAVETIIAAEPKSIQAAMSLEPLCAAQGIVYPSIRCSLEFFGFVHQLIGELFQTAARGDG